MQNVPAEGSSVSAHWDADASTLTITGDGTQIINQETLSSILINGDASLSLDSIRASIANLKIEHVDKVASSSNVSLFHHSAYPALTNVALTDITTVGRGAFSANANLTTLTIDGFMTIESKSAGYQYSDGPFQNCVGLVDATIKGNGKNSGSVIGSNAFASSSADSTQGNVLTIRDVETISDSSFSYVNFRELVVDNVQKIGGVESSMPGWLLGTSFSYSKLTKATISNTGLIYGSSFSRSNLLTDVVLTNVDMVDDAAFVYCPALTHVTCNQIGTINADAFYGCTALKTLTVDGTTRLGYIATDRNIKEIFDLVSGLQGRIRASMAGKFFLDPAKQILELKPESGWTDTTKGASNAWNSYQNQTQILDQARWKEGTNSTVAQAQVQAYTTLQKQMDFVFVLDMSSSMQYIGAESDMNAKCFELYSKVQDVAGALLEKRADIDCKVAFVTFAGSNYNRNLRIETTGFYDDYAAVEKEFLSTLTPPMGYTPFDSALEAAKELLDSRSGADQGRNVSIILISDGIPEPTSYYEEILNGAKAAADSIKANGAAIFGVTMSIEEDYKPYADSTMKTICSDGLYFDSDDAKSFSDAVNQAINEAYGHYTMSIPVGANYNGSTVANIVPSCGSAAYNAKTNAIEWKITGMPFQTHTLTYEVTLKKLANGTYPNGTFDVNDDSTGGAVLNNAGDITVNTMKSPKLSRAAEPTPTVTVQPTATPTVPPIDIPQTGDNSHLPLSLGLLLVSAAGLALILCYHQKKKYNH